MRELGFHHCTTINELIDMTNVKQWLITSQKQKNQVSSSRTLWNSLFSINFLLGLYNDYEVFLSKSQC
jgi:hypothetical protein